MNSLRHVNNQFAVLVVSCDKYSDLWGPFFQLFWRFWPDCPFNVYLLNNNANPNIPRVTNITIGNDISWSDNLLKGVGQIREKYVFLFLDDIFLRGFVNTQEVLQTFSWMMSYNAKYMRMMPSRLVPAGVIPKGAIYRTSTSLSVWETNVLLDLLKPGESAWDFEVNGTVRSDDYDGFYCTSKTYFHVMHGVIKGKWQRSVVNKLKSLGIVVNLKGRKVMTPLENMASLLKNARSYFLTLCPSNYRRKIKDIITGGRYHYKLSTK